MKATFRISTGQYEYVEVVDDENKSHEEVKAQYDDLKRVFAENPGIPAKDFDKFVDNQLNGDSNQLEVYNQMSPEQQKTVQIIKRAIKRNTYAKQSDSE